MSNPIRRPVLAANWKMNHGPTEARAFMAAFLASYSARGDRTIVIFPPAVSLATVRDALGARRDIQLGIQTIHTEPKGAFTGENSAPMSKDAGARWVLVGHSERRHVFGESDEACAKKFAIALKYELTPMLCVGEKIEQREQGQTEDVVLRQLRAGLSLLEPKDRESFAIAYEPVWAIGTGKTATPGDASAVHEVIRRELGVMFESPDSAAQVPILYGGSVTRDNARTLLAAREVDGLLVGGASLDAASWSAIAST
ncbi:MAG TPA: triose-phosphate isomerase [Gemmatimonadaceae bacterium]|nr:triose-phosphate isomerase [Gemmatimonadaceae bacterium]